MAAVTIVFMLPTAIVFPAILRMVNTPPPSLTLSERRLRLKRRWLGEQEQEDDMDHTAPDSFAEILQSGGLI